MQDRDSRDSLSERVTKLELTTQHLGTDFEKIDSRLDILDDIRFKAARTETISETILQRLVTGDQQFVKILTALDAHDSRLSALEEGLTHLAGRDQRPSFATLQDDYLRRKTTHHVLIRILAALSALGTLAAAWLSGLTNIFHAKGP